MKNQAYREYMKALLGQSFVNIKPNSGLSDLLKTQEYRLLLLNLDIYRVKDSKVIHDVSHTILALDAPLQKDGNLYELLLENFYLDVMNRISESKHHLSKMRDSEDEMQPFYHLQKTLKEFGGMIGCGSNNVKIAELLGVMPSRISEWNKGKPIPNYINKYSKNIQNIPVWDLASQ